MKARLKRLAAAVDALALRERLFVFVAALMMLAAAADSLWLSPLWAEHKAARAALQRQSAEAKSLRDQLRGRLGPAAGAAPDDSSRLNDELVQRRADLADVSGAIRRLAASPDEAARLPDLLQQVLKRHERLTLVKLATVPDDTPAGRALRRQGVDVTLAGRYADLARDLAALEQALPGLRWGALQLSALPAADGATLTVRVFLVEVSS